jgi:hypothetical protein
MDGDWITVLEASKLLRESANTTRARIRAGELPVVGYVNGRIVVLSKRNVLQLAAKKAAVASC